MYKKYLVRDTIRVPSEYFDRDLDEVLKELLEKNYEGIIDRDMGLIVSVFNIKIIGDGLIYPGDPATHHDVEFEALTFIPQVNEVVSGEVTELIEFGAFVRIGPMDGLVHVSQITDDFVFFDKKNQMFNSKKSNIILKKGDEIFARISTVSIKTTLKDSKIALTMRPEGLGKLEWTKTKQLINRHSKFGNKGRGRKNKINQEKNKK
ncbi:MAG: DNA-directed RNA polymerase [Candidatus Marsarchaeota archaeon]|nr:DNA-directed RNA polymerase [Candidatus Marsarchaeota archaeon]MCL5094510.1 DNA-directed RNA polymerase [Candidatus Marsarchaeota archaeon]